jgi:hypothetical protein
MRVLRLAILTALAFAALAAGAQAHHQIDESRWWFGGNTYGGGGSPEEAGDPIDPVNLLFYPGWFGQDEINDHFNAHIGRPASEPNEWIEHEQMTENPSFCRNDQWVRYRRIGPTEFPWEYVKTNFHGALVEHSTADCANRYHIRMWGDAAHESLTGTQHSQDEAWIVGAAHYEELDPTHKIRLDWDAVEHRIARFMRPHAYSLRWKCLPNSYGLYQNYRSDGRITRISINHGEGESTPATPQNGQC